MTDELRAQTVIPAGARVERRDGRHTVTFVPHPLNDAVHIDQLVLTVPVVPDDGAAPFLRGRSALVALRMALRCADVEHRLGTAIGQMATRPGRRAVTSARLRLLDGALHAWLVLGQEGTAPIVLTAVGYLETDGDRVGVAWHRVAAFAPLPVPARTALEEAVAALVAQPAIAPRLVDFPGTPDPYGWEVSHHGLRIHAAKAVLGAILPAHGWKLPALAPGTQAQVDVRDQTVSVIVPRDLGAGEDLSSDRHGGAEQRALARAQERAVFDVADAALHAGDLGAALAGYRRALPQAGVHPGLVARLGDALVADACRAPSEGASRAELHNLCAAALQRDPHMVEALLLSALQAELSDDQAPAGNGSPAPEAPGRQTEAVAAWRRLAASLDPAGLPFFRAAALVAQARHDPQGTLEQTVVALREALRLVPDEPGVLAMLAAVYAARSDHAGRVDVLRRLAVIGPAEQRGRALLELAGLLHAHLGARDEARRILHAALELSLTFDTLEEAAQVAAVLGDTTTAIRLCNELARRAEAAENGAAAAEAYCRAAQLWLAPLGDASSARLACHAALRAHPQHAAAMQLLARIHQEAGEYDAAIAALEPLLADLERRRLTSPAQGPELTAALLATLRTVAQVSLTRGDQAEAVSAYRRLFSLSPHDDDAFAWLSAYYEAHEQPAELVDLLARHVEVTEDELAARALMLELADLYENTLSLAPDALHWVRRAAAAGPPNAVIQQRLVDLYEKTGRHFQLREALGAQVDQSADPDKRAQLLLRIGRLNLEVLADPAQAVVALRRATALRPTDREVLLSLRAALRAVGALEDLTHVLERLAGMTTEPVARRNLLIEAGDVCFLELGKPQQAYRFYREAAELSPDPHLQSRLTQILERARAAAGPPTEQAAPPAGPPTDVGPAVEAQEQRPALVSWRTVNVAAPEPEPEPLPDPVSEELEITLMAPEAGRVELKLIALEPAATSDSTRPEAMELPTGPGPSRLGAWSGFGEPPPGMTAGTLPDRPTHRAAGERDEGADPRAPTLPEVPAPGPGPAFVAPNPRDAPDWREAARKWSSLAAADAADVLEEVPSGSGVGRPDETSPQPIEAAPRYGAQTERLDEPVSHSAALGPIDVFAPTPEHGAQAPASLPVPSLDEARRNGDASAIVEALMAALPREEDPTERARMQQEIGCRAYFDLEDLLLARKYLEAACASDPDGVARELETLSALEGVYEDLREWALLVDVYDRKRKQADTPELERVLGLLMAQICFEKLARPRDAQRLLRSVVDVEPANEPALRLLAEVDRSLGDLDDAAAHLEALANVLPAASPELADVFVALADLYYERGSIDKSKRVFGRALSISEAPMHVLDRMKHVCRAGDDWIGLLEALVAELALAVGEDHESFTLDQLLGVPAARFPGSVRRRASQTLREIGDVLSLKLGASEQGWRVYAKVLELLPDDVYALERRIELGRELERWGPLARDLEALVPLLLDLGAQFETLVEVSTLYQMRLGDPLRSRGLLERAVQLFAASPVTSTPAAPGALPRVENTLVPPAGWLEAVERLRRLNENVVVHVTLGNARGAAPAAPAESHELSDGVAVFDPFDRTDVVARLSLLDANLDSEKGKGRRVELLTEKGLLLSRYPETQRDALISLRAALALEPNHVPARIALVDGLLANGEVEQALNHIVVLVQRAQPAALDSNVLQEVHKLVEVIIATGQRSVAARARNLLDQLPERPH